MSIAPALAEAIRTLAPGVEDIRRGFTAPAPTESGGRPFRTVDGEQRPPIAPEPHVFYRLLSGAERDRAVTLGLAHPRSGGVPVPASCRGRYDFLARMAAINVEAAHAATSRGWGQVMGHHAERLGFVSAVRMAGTCLTAEGQTDVARAYLEEFGLLTPLRNLPDRASAERFAKGCNGPAWRRNDDASRLIAAWHAAGEAEPVAPGRGAKDLQRALAAGVLHRGEIDGSIGRNTKAALRAFQREAGLAIDGDAGPMTWAALETAAEKRAQEAKARGVRTLAAVGTAAGAGQALVGPIREATEPARSAHDFGDALQPPALAVGLLAFVAVGVLVWRWAK